jgi:hypothetical protein
MKNIPFITYLQRYWLLLVLVVVTVAACLNDWLFQKLGALLYIPAAAAVTVATVLLIVHLFFRETIDTDIHTGVFIADWRSLNSLERARITAVYVVGLTLAIALVAAAVGK